MFAVVFPVEVELIVMLPEVTFAWGGVSLTVVELTAAVGVEKFAGLVIFTCGAFASVVFDNRLFGIEDGCSVAFIDEV
jgi:hypothetical protein